MGNAVPAFALLLIKASIMCFCIKPCENRFAVGLMHLGRYAFSRTSQRSAKSWAELLRAFSEQTGILLTIFRGINIIV